MDTAGEVMFSLRISLVNVNNSKSTGTWKFFSFSKDVFKEKHRFLRSRTLTYCIVIASGSFSEFFDTGQVL